MVFMAGLLSTALANSTVLPISVYAGNTAGEAAELLDLQQDISESSKETETGDLQPEDMEIPKQKAAEDAGDKAPEQKAEKKENVGEQPETVDAAALREKASEGVPAKGNTEELSAPQEESPVAAEVEPLPKEALTEARNAVLPQEILEGTGTPVSQEKLQELKQAIDDAEKLQKEPIYQKADPERQDAYETALSMAGKLYLSLKEKNDGDTTEEDVNRAIEDLKKAESRLNGTEAKELKLRREIELEEIIKKSFRYLHAEEQEKKSYDDALDHAKEAIRSSDPQQPQRFEECLTALRGAKEALHGKAERGAELSEFIDKAVAAIDGEKFKNADAGFQQAYKEALLEAQKVYDPNRWASDEDVERSIKGLKKKLSELENPDQRGKAEEPENGRNKEKEKGGSSDNAAKPENGQSGGTADNPKKQGDGANKGVGSGKRPENNGGASKKRRGSGRRGGSSRKGSGRKNSGRKVAGFTVKPGNGNAAPMQTVVINRPSLDRGKWVNENGRWKLEISAAADAKADFASGQWAKLDSGWYLIGQDGYMCTGMVKVNNANYYFDASGAMQTGWVRLNNKWYYFHPASGAMQTGWLHQEDKWYFLKEDGSMAVNETTSDGYKVDASGNWMK